MDERPKYSLSTGGDDAGSHHFGRDCPILIPESLIFGIQVVKTSLSEEDEESLKKALEHPDVKEGAEDHLDLDEGDADGDSGA